jgi:exonuclease SbcC
MVIKNLRLVNYRRFASLTLEFPENLIGIIGQNGTGKSTIVEAIGWTLFGTRIARTDKLEIRSQFLQDNRACSAEIEFLYGQHEYRIVRQLKGKNAISEAAVYRDGQAQAEAVQERGVNEYIESLLKLDYRSFLASTFARQKDLAALSSMQPEERRKSINRLIGIDQIDLARERIRRDRNEKRSFIDGMRTSLKDPAELEIRKEALLHQQADKATIENAAKESIKDKALQLSQAKEALELQNQKRDLFMQWQAQIGKLDSRENENEKNLKRARAELQEIAQDEKELASLTADLKDFDKIKAEKERLDDEATKAARLDGKSKEKGLTEKSLAKETNHVNELKPVADELTSLDAALEEKKIREQGLEKQIGTWREKAKLINGQKEAVKRAGLDIKEKSQRIKELGPEGRCPLCTQPLKDHYEEVLTDLESQLGKLREELRAFQEEEGRTNGELKTCEDEHKALRSEKERLIKQHSTAKEASKNLLRAQEAVENFSAQLVVIEKEILAIGQVDYDESLHKQLKGSYDKMQKMKERATQLAERVNRRAKVEANIGEIEQMLRELLSEREESKTKQQELGFDEVHYQKSRKDLENKTSILDEAREELAKVREDLVGLSKELDRLDAEIEEQKDKRQKIESAEEVVIYLNALDEHFGRFRLELAGRIRPLIAHRASALFSLTTRARYSTIELDEDYNIRIYDGNSPFAIERFSGGEQDLANLCLRIAISQVVAERSGGAPINFIVLDEIFGSQDAERQDLILNSLGQLTSQFRQIFLITHVDAIKDMLPVVIEVTIQDSQISTANMI